MARILQVLNKRTRLLLVLAIGVVLISIGIVEAAFPSTRLEATATVIVSEKIGDSYRTTLTFNTKDGQVITSKITGSSSYSVGSTLDILYAPTNPSNVIEHTIFESPLATFALGIPLLGVGIYLYFSNPGILNSSEVEKPLAVDFSQEGCPFGKVRYDTDCELLNCEKKVDCKANGPR